MTIVGRTRSGTPGLFKTWLPGANPENVGDGPGRGVRVVFAERGLVAAELFESEATGVYVQLGLGTALQMLRGHDANARGQHFLVQVMHRKRGARENEEDTASVVFAESGLTPPPVLVAPLIGTRAFDESQILHGGTIVLEDRLHGSLRPVEVEDVKGRRVRIVRIERGDGPIAVYFAVVCVLAKTHESYMGLAVGLEHACVDGGRELLRLAPFVRCMVGAFARATRADRL